MENEKWKRTGGVNHYSLLIMHYTLDTIPDRLSRFFHLIGVVSTFYHANPDNRTKSMDITRDDVKALFRSLNAHEVDYLLVGGMATAVHGYVRATEDLDLWIRIGADNKSRLIIALAENEVVGAAYLQDVPLIFGWSSVSVGKRGFTLDMGHALKAFADTEFDTCYEKAFYATFDDVPFKVINIRDLIKEKQATGRLKDLADVEELIKIRDRNAA